MSKCSNLANKFSLFEKIPIRVTFYGLIIIGALSIYAESLLWGLIYTVFLIFGAIILLSCLCTHCLYPFRYSDCLILPFKVIKKICKFRSQPMGIIDTFGFIIVLGGIVIIPQYWLFKNNIFLILFWVFCFPTFAIFPLYFCRRCRHLSCPFNHPSKR